MGGGGLAGLVLIEGVLIEGVLVECVLVRTSTYGLFIRAESFHK